MSRIKESHWVSVMLGIDLKSPFMKKDVRIIHLLHFILSAQVKHCGIRFLQDFHHISASWKRVKRPQPAAAANDHIVSQDENQYDLVIINFFFECVRV